MSRIWRTIETIGSIIIIACGLALTAWGLWAWIWWLE